MSTLSLIGFRSALTAELLRSRRSAAGLIPLAGLTIGVLQGASWWVTASAETAQWEHLFFWHTIYHTALLVPFAVITAALIVNREKRAREGGALWRPIGHHTAVIARTTVLAMTLGLLALAVNLPTLVFGLAKGLTDPPLIDLLTIALAQWLLSLLPAVSALGLAGLIGMLPTIGLGIVWQAAGTLMGETPTWIIQPWTWSVRASLPLLGIHQNGVSLAPGSPILEWSPWEPVAVSIACTAIVVLLWSLMPTVRYGLRRPTLRRTPAHHVASLHASTGEPPRTVRRNIFSAVASAQRRTPILLGLVLSIASCLLIAMVWTDPETQHSYLRGWISYIIVPFGACLLAATTWNTHREAWPILATRASTNQLAVRVFLLAAIQFSIVILAGTLFIQGPGTPAFALLATTTGIAALTVNLMLASRFGQGSALAVTLIAFAFGAVAATQQMSETLLWPAAFFVWSDSFANTTRLPVALSIGMIIIAIGFLGWLKQARRAAS